MVLSLDPDHDTVAGYSRDLGGAVVMGHHRWFLAVLVCACLLDPSISYAAELEGEEGAASPELSQAETVLDDPAAEAPSQDEPVSDPPIEEAPSQDEPEPGPSGGEVVIEDEDDVYHIDADTVIIQTIPADETPPDGDPDLSEDLEDSDPEDEDLPLETDLEQEPVLEDPPDIVTYALGADGFPFYGSCWVRGRASSLGDVLLLFPMNYRDGYIGLDSSGRIFNVSNNSWTGLLYAGSSSYTVTFGAWGLPTYRVYNGSSYQNVTLYLAPEDTDILLPRGPSSVYRVSDLLPYAAVLLLGGVFICCMKRS